MSALLRQPRFPSGAEIRGWGAGATRVPHRHDAIDRPDEANQLIDCGVALLFVEARILTLPLEFIQDRMLRFLAPMKQKYVLP